MKEAHTCLHILFSETYQVQSLQCQASESYQKKNIKKKKSPSCILGVMDYILIVTVEFCISIWFLFSA